MHIECIEQTASFVQKSVCLLSFQLIIISVKQPVNHVLSFKME